MHLNHIFQVKFELTVNVKNIILNRFENERDEGLKILLLTISLL